MYTAAMAIKKRVLEESPISALEKISNQDLNGFAAVFFPGGHGPMQDMLKNPDVARVLNHFHQAKKTTALVCHAPAVLVSTAGKTGFPYRGYKVTAFTDAEEIQSPIGAAMVITPQKALTHAGAVFVAGPDWQSHIEEDRELITGQNPASSQAIAEAIVRRLREN